MPLYAACARPIVSVMKKCLALGYLALNEHLPPRHEGPDGCTQIDALNRKRERGAVLAELVAEGPISPCLNSKTCSHGNVLTVQSDYGYGHPEDARTTAGPLVRRRVTHSTRPSLLQAAQRSPRQRQV